MHFGSHYWGMHLFWWIFWLVAIASILVWLVPARRDSARQILRRRYAAGEITEDEYRRGLDVLASGHAGHGSAA